LGDAFDNLAMAATAKNDTIDKLVSTVAKLTATNATLTEQLKKALAATSNNNRNRERTGGGERANGGGGGGGNRNNNTRAWPDWCDPDAYCWTCGYKLKKGHTSANCRFCKNPGHKKEAMTCKNTMGGSQLNAEFGNAPNGK